MSKKSPTTKAAPAAKTSPAKAAPALEAAAPARTTTPVVAEASRAAKPTAPVSVATAKSAAPSQDQIAKRAYEIYLARGQSPGRDAEDWMQAERELKSVKHAYN